MSNSAAGEIPRKRSKTSPPPSSSRLSSLPDEMVLSCLARVSRSDLAALSLVSKSYRHLVASPQLYKMRSLFDCTENRLYVCLLTPPDPTPRWFILCCGKTGSRVLNPIPSPIPSFPSQAPEGSSFVALDWGIYVIGGWKKGKPTCDVLLLDCRTHTWRQLPSMGVARSCPAVGVVCGKVYVFGGCRNSKCSNWAEVFDPKTQTWDSLPPFPDQKVRCRYIHGSVVVREEKVCALHLNERTLYYSPIEGKWGRGTHSETPENKRDWCVIDKFIYSVDMLGKLYWCVIEELECSKPEVLHWRVVKGLGSLKERLSSSRLVQFDGKLEGWWESYKVTIGREKKLKDLLPGARVGNSGGGNLVLWWDVIEGGHLEVWCAEISLERRQGGEIWGNIEWSNAVMTVDPFLHHYKVLHSVSVTL